MDNNNNLKERRKALGLRLRDLAEKVEYLMVLFGITSTEEPTTQ